MALSEGWRCAKLRAHGEVAEWSKAHAWKVCIRQRIEGSNPSLSAIFEIALRQGEYVAGHVLSPLRAFLPN